MFPGVSKVSRGPICVFRFYLIWGEDVTKRLVIVWPWQWRHGPLGTRGPPRMTPSPAKGLPGFIDPGNGAFTAATIGAGGNVSCLGGATNFSTGFTGAVERAATS